MKSNRLLSIEIGRLVFCFMVVCIHTGRYEIFSPLLRCAVPFFLLVTGYFCFNEDINKCNSRFAKSALNYFKIYFKAMVVLLPISIILNFLVDGSLDFTLHDFKNLILYGTGWESLRILNLKEINILGPLWYLYDGTLSLFFIYTIKKLLKVKLDFIIFFVCLYFLFVYVTRIFNCGNFCHRPDITMVMFPCLLAGVFLSKYKCLFMRSNTYVILFVTLLLLVLIYIEYNLGYSKKNGVEFFSIPFVACVFILLNKWNIKKNNFIESIPSKTMMDIYIWHVCMYCLLDWMGLTHILFLPLWIFLSLFTISYSLRTNLYCRLLKNMFHTNL
jgi:surface polysaccharide O-acyltransferase-like enzyme